MDLISVIIPVYNSELYLHDCIDSVICQTYSQIEIILVDDGSTDSSGVICDSYAKKYNNIIVIHKSNGGVSSARNVGIQNAKGRYICFIDSDDSIDEEMVNKLHSAFDNKDNCISLCKMSIVQNNIKRPFIENFDHIKKPYFRIKKLIYGDIFGSVSRCMFPKSIINGLRFKNVRHCEDQLFFIEATNLASDIKIVNESLYMYRQNNNSGGKERFYSGFLDDRWTYIYELENILFQSKLSSRQNKCIINMAIINLKVATYFNAVLSHNMQNDIKEIDMSPIGTYKVRLLDKVRYFNKAKFMDKVVFILVSLRCFDLLKKIRTRKK